MSSALVWELVRNHNSFLVKRNGLRLTKEPFNLTQLHTPKYSGLANFSGVDVQPAKNGFAVQSVKANYDSAPAAAAKSKAVLRKGFKRAAVSVVKTVGAVRPSLKAAALSRLSKVHKSVFTNDKVLKKRIARKSRAARK